MIKRFVAALFVIVQISLLSCVVQAASLPRYDTAEYKVSYYAYDCFNMQDENGQRYGYGYDMMQNISKYLQCTFAYVGYDKTARENEEMLRTGQIDLYTAAKKTPEREAEFIFSEHPSITATTCMNVKVGNRSIVAGDYSTYAGIRIGLLSRHTYNSRFEAWADSKGFAHTIIYYETPAELTNALITGEVDAIVNSYIGTPEDERIIEQFEETPYYLMARKEDRALMDQIDVAIDEMNVETPNWRTELYNEYYGSPSKNDEFTAEEQAYLATLQQSGTVLRAVMDPDGTPYSWYENGTAHGIAADLFAETANRLGLAYEIIPVSSKAEYLDLIESGNVDVWMDMTSTYEDENAALYKQTDPYLTTTVSLLQRTDSSSSAARIAILHDNIATRSIAESRWPNAELIVEDSLEQCSQDVLNGRVDGALLMTYTAQQVRQKDTFNRLRANIVPSVSVQLRMGINAQTSYLFYGLWDKTLSEVSSELSAEIVQHNVNITETESLLRYLYTHPEFLGVLLLLFVAALLFLALFIQSSSNSRRHQQLSRELAEALKEARSATEAKQNFFSKMSHDIRTPMNVVLGMTQVAKKYKNDPQRLDSALDNIATEGRYLLVLINSILDVNQLEHGRIDLNLSPCSPAACLQESADILRPLADKKEQHLTVTCDEEDHVVLGDAGRISQIIINILSNAIKYTPGGGHITLRLETLPDDRYRFVCTDDGIGMSEEFLQHIGEEYHRAEDSRISKTEGTGLGMSVVKGFTELMGGTLTVHSKLGEGSTFIVELPLAPAAEEQRNAVLHPPVQEPSTAAYTGKEVLLVEDNVLNAEIATELLQTIGLSVDWAENGKLGVEKFEASRPNQYFAVFMDMQMPVMDGIEATRCIRRSPRPDHNLPIFAMTANTFSGDRDRCRDAGMNGYLSKPVAIRELQAIVNEIPTAPAQSA